MTTLPNHTDQMGGNRAWQRDHVPLVNAEAMDGGIGPGRDIRQVMRKTLPDGRVFDWVYQLETRCVPPRIFTTWTMVESPTLDCSCSAARPDLFVCCSSCQKAVCIGKHSGTCQSCGAVFCSQCMTGIYIHRREAVVCKACAIKLTAPLYVKLFFLVKKFILWMLGNE